MKTRDIKKVIQQSAKEEFILNPNSFLADDGNSTKRCTENISLWAIHLWESRTDEEIQRDFRRGLHVDNYIVWAFEAFNNTFPVNHK